jgi:pimeloyl-ACP methyl ester carboxylesterase
VKQILHGPAGSAKAFRIDDLSPVLLDLRDSVPCVIEGSKTPRRWEDEFGAAIAGVRPALEVSELLELVDELRRPALADVMAPTLIITGDELVTWTPADARAAAARLAHGTAAVVPGTRHLAPLEAAPAIAELVTEFWRNTAGREETPTGSDHGAIYRSQ